MSFLEAVRGFDPIGKAPPVLCEPLQRVAWEVMRHFQDWRDESIDRLLNGIDAMVLSVEKRDEDFHQAFGVPEYMRRGDVDLLGLEDGVLAGPYRYFVCSQVEGSKLADALMAHALGTAARANAVAHELAEQEAATSEQYERLAGFGMTAESLLGTAKLSRQGVLYADRKASEQGRIGAESRHSDLRRIKDRFIEYYRSGDFRSKADAARRYYLTLPDHERKVLAPSGGKDGAVRTLRETLQRHGL